MHRRGVQVKIRLPAPLDPHTIKRMTIEEEGLRFILEEKFHDAIW